MVIKKTRPYNDENCIFSCKYSNKDILLDVSSQHLNFEELILHIVMEGTMSQNFNLGLSFDFIDSRKEKFKKIKRKSPVFSNKIKTKP